MADVKTQIKDQMATVVSATVADPNVQADLSAVPAIINALGPVIDAVLHSTNQEPWYKSRVVWGSSVAVVGVILARFHVDFPPALQGEVTNDIVTAIPLIGSIYALYGRFRAKAPIGTTPPAQK
ncbi:hypothetical protein FHT86_002128 [Rhizobium sp. BK313]|uniref:hypothetical protein n=1 Tax=Rhizobium sp. BK313 TaxID=2587081 RepID=UPI001609B10B|nr:hypothetical protein [Rhizobium sp. BK313]MBB3453872.1 hypothetical protein [Rhizobium sp. BK313]